MDPAKFKELFEDVRKVWSPDTHPECKPIHIGPPPKASPTFVVVGGRVTLRIPAGEWSPKEAQWSEYPISLEEAKRLQFQLDVVLKCLDMSPEAMARFLKE